MEIMVAILTLAGAVVGAIITFIVAKKQNYVTATTQSRIEWIRLLRELSAEFINNCNHHRYNEAEEVLTKIRIHMNPIGKIDNNIIETAEFTLRYGSTYKFESQIKSYLKTEWERVKCESKGKRYTEYQFVNKYIEIKERILITEIDDEEPFSTKRTYEDRIAVIMAIIKVVFAIIIIAGIAIALVQILFGIGNLNEIISK